MEWIMINVRIGKETFCKYAAKLNLMYTCTPLSLKPLCASLCVLFAQSCPSSNENNDLLTENFKTKILLMMYH